MPYFNTILLPPILEYTYPAFRYELDGGENNPVTINAYLSITNTIDQVDHIQIKIVSLNTNKNALNPELFPTGYYFIKIDETYQDLNFTINTVINGKNIFSINNEEPYSSYYKMQIRLGIKSVDNYQSEWGQNVSQDWLNNNKINFSEWSNSTILKTLDRPDFGIFTLSEDETTTLSEVNYLWEGYYDTQDNNESLKRYSFELYDNNKNLLEVSDNFYIGEYETPSISYRFNEIFIHDLDYYIRLNIETVTGYLDYKEYKIRTQFSYVKLFNIVNIKENDEDAHNLIEIKVKQILLETTEPINDENWLKDENMEDLGETGVTHLKIDKGYLKPKDGDFLIPYNNFYLLLSITNFQNKIQNKLKNCFINDNWILYLYDSQKNYQYYIGVYSHNNKINFVLKTIFEKTINYYYIEEDSNTIAKNEEYLLSIIHSNGIVRFNSLKWHTNNFIK